MALRSDLHGQELVAVKDGGSAEALRREAALLRELDHPGIIRFVAFTEDERGLRLLTRYAGRETLATWQPRRLEELRRVVEDLAGTVHYLHERGVTHRSIRPGHVVIDALRRPLLCGFSASRRVVVPHDITTNRIELPGHLEGGGTDREPEAPSGDGWSGPETGVDTAGEQVADVVAIGETVIATLQRLDGHSARSGRKRDEQRLRERLGAVAQAAAGGRVLTANALAGQIQALGTELGTPRAPRSDDDARTAVHEATADPPAADDRRGRSAEPSTATSVAPAGGRGAAGGEGGPHPGAPSEAVLQRLRAPAAHRSGSRRRPLGGRPNSSNRFPEQAPWRSRRARQRPRRATLLAAAAVCGGCALGTLMVMRLSGEDASPPAMLQSNQLGGPGTAAAGSAGRGGTPPGRDPGAVPTDTTAAEPPTQPDRAPASVPAPPAGTSAEHSRVAPVPPPLPAGGPTGCRAIADGFRDVTGDGCAEQIDLTAGFVSVDGARYPIGEAGDQVAVGDWDCDGVATVALVQPGGQVYVFDSWPRHTPLVGRLVADLPPPVQLADVPRGACNELLVRYAEGTWHLPLPTPSE